MDKNFVKKGFYIAQDLADYWEVFHAPSKDYSPSAAAGMLLYMAADMPNLRETVRKLAMEKDIKKAVAKTREALVRAVRKSEILELSSRLGDDELQQILEAAIEKSVPHR